MRSFTTIATFASLAFAAVCSALPAPHSYGAVASHGYEVATRGEATDAPAVISGVYDHYEHHEYPRGDAQKSVLDIVVDVTAEVKPLCDKLTAAISGDVEVDAAVKISLEILGEIKVILVKAVVDIKACIAAGAGLLVLGGVEVTLAVVAKLVAELLVVVLTVIALVLKVCAVVDISAILALVVDIVFQLSCIVSLILSIAAGLLAVLVPLLGDVIAICREYKLFALLDVLAVVHA
jgi:hypothetical protein